MQCNPFFNVIVSSIMIIAPPTGFNFSEWWMVDGGWWIIRVIHLMSEFVRPSTDNYA